jgi:hypothetical protein
VIIWYILYIVAFAKQAAPCLVDYPQDMCATKPSIDMSIESILARIEAIPSTLPPPEGPIGRTKRQRKCHSSHAILLPHYEVNQPPLVQKKPKFVPPQPISTWKLSERSISSEQVITVAVPTPCLAKCLQTQAHAPLVRPFQLKFSQTFDTMSISRTLYVLKNLSCRALIDPRLSQRIVTHQTSSHKCLFHQRFCHQGTDQSLLPPLGRSRSKRFISHQMIPPIFHYLNGPLERVPRPRLESRAHRINLRDSSEYEKKTESASRSEEND